MSASKSRRARHRQLIASAVFPRAGVAAGHGDYEAASNATPELFVTSATPRFDPQDSLWDSTIDEALLEGRSPYTLLDDEDDELEALNRAARALFDTEVVHDWARFDDDERWRETARTGRAL